MPAFGQYCYRGGRPQSSKGEGCKCVWYYLFCRKHVAVYTWLSIEHSLQYTCKFRHPRWKYCASLQLPTKRHKRHIEHTAGPRNATKR